PFQSAAAIARDLDKIEPAVVIAAEEDFAEDIFCVLREKHIAAVALREMDAIVPAGFERTDRTAPDNSIVEPQIEILTSGTTGAPKPFALSYATIAQHIVGGSGMPSANVDLSQAPPAIMFFPVGNISGFHSTLPPLLKGQRAVLLERFN